VTLQLGTDKRKAKDDSVDSMRYALTKIPFDFSHVGYVPVRETVLSRRLSPHEISLVERNKDRLRMMTSGVQREDAAHEEIREWNEFFGADSSFYDEFF
jgi:hypothetical protein